ncbi:response regulator (plasmid) [Devosia neptuniae]|uniref:Response regulator n=1 Tax=Devosia neptuniae TaxID=191302 RepID=A0ABY6CD19_9HYPH|nr:response regulator [Devosia neptuniae]UXN68008.1 response regulator [Devosia neptuniae]
MTGPIVVLVVEDDAITRINIVDALHDEGFKVHEAPTSEEALQTLDAELGVDCLLTDVDLGAGLDGLRLASQARGNFPLVEIVVVSGQLRQMPTDVPDARFFIKPYDPATIADAVRAMVLEGRNRNR